MAALSWIQAAQDPGCMSAYESTEMTLPACKSALCRWETEARVVSKGVQ